MMKRSLRIVTSSVTAMCVHSNAPSDETVDNWCYVDFAFILKITRKMTFSISAHFSGPPVCTERTTDARNGRPFSRHSA
jgi:hypothetical protein